MPVRLSSEEGLPETAVKASKRPFMIAAAIISHLKKIIIIINYYY